MNELLNHLNNYAKKRKNKHRFSAVMVCLAVIVSFTVYIGLIEPAESASGQLACGMEEHEHTQDCFELICGFDDESEEEISVDTTEIGSEETTETTCETEETTTEKTETTTSTEAEETAPVHVHSDKCYRLICLTEAHLHKQDCYNQPVETTEPAATTETSASISTGTTMSTEQTTETTTTTTELSEEVYELNAALFGELYMDRVNILADSPVYIDEYKFYYVNGVLNAHSCFSYPDNATGNPNNNSIKRTYNGIEYKMAYSFEKNAENVRYITLKAPTNGTWILLFGDVEKTFNINIKYNDNVVKSQLFNDTSNGIMVVPVESGKTYKAYQNTDDESKARLVYAEFVPTVTPVDGGTYRIRNVKNGLYVEVENADTTNGAKIKTGQYSYDDKRNDFKFEDAGDENFYIYPQLDYSANGIQMLDYSNSSGDIQTYNTNEKLSNKKFKFNFNNDNGTYKINSYVRKEDTVVNLYVDNNYVKASETATGDDFIIVEATEMVKPEVVYPVAEIDTNTTYLIKNVRSRLYVHNDDGNIVQKKDVGVESQFKFISTGTAGEYYIVSADENYALTTDWTIQNGTAVKYAAKAYDENYKNPTQLFHAEQMENGSVRFYQENNGKKYYLGIPYTTVAAGANIALYEADSVEDQMCFFLVPVIAPAEVHETNTRVEARVIFADYNDGKFELYKDTDDKVISGEKQAGDVKTNERNLYDEPAWTPTIELYKGNESNPIYTEKGNLVIDVSEARKDWCYQYNYVWNLGTDTTNEYTVKLNGVNSGNKITLNGKEFNVYYLKDTELNHPGNNGNSNAPAEAYKQTPYSQAGDQIIYIFLDPVVEEWWPNGNQPATFDLSMKKRWDGHNASGYRNRPKEKIKIQLQHLVNGEWVKFDSNEYMNEYYYEVTDDDGNRHMVNTDKIGTEFVYYKNGEYYTDENCTTKWEKVTYDGLKGTADALDPQKEKRLIVKMVSSEDWNDIVLTVGGENNPQHFTNGYYYNWKAIPYGQYRVIETMSFYDANENDVFDEGDRDTSNEYYYMSYPPMRDSRGVLHIQNFTKDMVLDIQKEWYDDQGTVKLDNPGKTVKVNIYRSLKKKNNPAANDSELELVYPDVDVSNDNIILKTTDGYDKLLLKTTSEQKYYYYIQEVSVDGYLLLNGNDEGFVKSTNGNYYVDYEDGDGRKFIIENKAKVGIKLEKEWYTDKNSNSKMTFAEGNEPNAEFEIYMSDRLGTPLYSNGEFKVEYEYYINNHDTDEATQTLTRIADAKIDKNGQFEIYSGEENKGEGTSKVISDQLHIFGDEEVFNGTKTFNADATTKGVFEPQNAPWQKENDYYILPGGKDNRLYVKPRHGFGGILELTFEKVQDTDHIKWFDGDNKYLSEFDGYESGKDLVVTYPMNDGDNIYICRTEVEGTTVPRLKSAVFYPYNYYYIREKTGDTCELINGDSNGFVVLQDTNKYYLNLSADSDETRFPIVTAKNIPKVNLNITKEWTSSNAEISKVMDFEIYKAFAQGTPVADGEGYKVTVNNADYQLTKIDGTYKTNGEGNLDITNLPAFEEKDGTYHKLYYYVREIEGNYTTSDAINGFIPYESGQYGTAFDDTSSNSGKYNFVNIPKLEITVNKTWLDEKGNEDDKKAKTEIKFELYRKIENGTSELIKDGENNFFITEKHKKLIQNLDAYDSSGKKYNYYIVEISSDGNYSVDNYIVTYSVTNVSWNKDGKQPVINVTNQAKPQNYELPETGGIGTHGYTVTGGAIILLSAMILLFKRRTQL